MNLQSRANTPKTLCGAIALSLAIAGLMACEKKVELKTDEQRASYALGQNIGKSLVDQKVTVDPDVFAHSLRDAQKGESKMTKEEIQQAMMKLQEMAQKKSQEEGEKNKTEGAAFLEKNKNAEGVKVTASGLQYKVETEGTGKSPSKDDTVKVHYKGTLINGQQFDSSYERNQPAEFPVSGVIPGWTEALQIMKPGAKYKLFIPAELAYKDFPKPGIPPNSVLLFDVELLEVVKKK